MSMFLSVVLEQGEIPESLDGGPSIGKALAVGLDDLDGFARDRSCQPLSDFGVDYAEKMDELLMDDDLDNEDLEAAMQGIGRGGPWFDPDEGLQTVDALIQSLESSPAGERAALEDTLTAVRVLKVELEYAKQQGTRFHLALES